MSLNKYLTLGERREHCELQTKCGPKRHHHTIKKILLKHLGLTKADVVGMHLCHLCNHDSSNGGCSNPLHLYFGTNQENQWDYKYGHFNHPNTKSEAWLDPHCPTCGMQSNGKTAKMKRRKVASHIENGNCFSKRIKRFHPDFIKGE